jgi:hypothetical protein
VCVVVWGVATGPLGAVVKSQAQAAMTTVDFINSVGFHAENRSTINVDFSYITTNENGTDEGRVLTVPFLSMLPIPNLEVRLRRAASVSALHDLQRTNTPNDRQWR